MDRELLKNLGLTDEQAESVIAEHTKVESEAGNKATELQTKVDGLEKQLADRDKDLASLKKEAGSNTKLKEKYADLETKYKDDTAKLSGEISQTKLDNALDNALVSAKVRNPKTIRGLLNLNDIKLSDKGDLIGLNDQIDSLKESDSYLFDEGTKVDYEPGGGHTDKGADGKDDSESLADMAADARII